MKIKIITLPAIILAVSGLLTSPVRAQINLNLPQITKELKQTYSSIQNQFDDFDGLFEKTKTKVEKQLEKETDKITGGVKKDITGIADEVEKTVAETKRSVLELDSRFLGENAKKEYHQIANREQIEGIVGESGQQVMAQEMEVTATAAQTIQTEAQSAEAEDITQDKIQRLANQNAQIASLLQNQQTTLQRQNELSAMTNLNLGDISNNLEQQKMRKQNERQGAANAIYHNTLFLNHFWSSQNKR